MKTTDEIKKGLEQCVKAESGETGCSGCPYIMSCIKEEDPDSIMADALAYIQQLETRLAQVERERDALSHDMHQLQGAICAYCKNLYRPDAANHTECRVFGDLSRFGDGDERSQLICGKFGWRGLCEENTHDQP